MGSSQTYTKTLKTQLQPSMANKKPEFLDQTGERREVRGVMVW